MSFEPLRDDLEALRVPEGEARRLVWVVRERLGAALTASGSYEIFLLGPELTAASPLVARHLQHDRWEEPEPGGEAFEATRVLLGSAAHFAAVAALIATELARLDLSTDQAVQQAFTEVEPIIEMAIRRSALSDEALIGLIAELHVLRAALVAVDKEQRPIVLTGWHGWTKGRDFIFGDHALEVKATTGPQSRHHFSGVHQLEPQRVEGTETEHLRLLSMGLTETESGGQSLPDIVEDLLSLLQSDGAKRGPVQQQLLAMIANYGEAGSAGYDHDNVRHWQVYQRRFVTEFGRLYDISDSAVRLLTRELLEDTFAVVETVSFTLLFPDRISGFNPQDNWQGEIAATIGRWVS